MVQILISSEKPSYLKIKDLKKDIGLAINSALDKLKLQRKLEGEVSVYLCTDATMQKINHETRGKNKPTNVLSFPFLDVDLRKEKLLKQHSLMPVGEIICSVETLRREAKEQGKKLSHHLIHLFVHSTLHLFGYDHMVEKEAEQMEKLEIDILKKLDIPNPY